MSECKYKAKDGECLYEKRFPYKEYCVEGPCPHDTPMTNADRIRQMTDEELAHLLHTAEEHIFGGNLWDYKQWTEWLKSPVEEVDDA